LFFDSEVETSNLTTCCWRLSTFLICQSDIIRQVKSRQMRWAGHAARLGAERKVLKNLVGKPEGKRPLGRPGCGWENMNSMDLREIGLGVWIGFDWLRTVTGGGLL
jgi:hypothetical protein